jgi:hypothetical protein
MVTRVVTQHHVEPLITFTSISDKLFDSTVPLIFERDDDTAAKATKDCYTDLLDKGRTIGAFPYRVGIDTMGNLTNRLTLSSAFQRRIREALDPDDLLSPGRYRD